MDLSDRVTACSAMVFDLFHTLVRVPPDEDGGRTTAEMLGVDRLAWNRALWEDTHDRLVGIDRDSVSILRSVAHSIDPTIPEDRIRIAADSRLRRFARSLTEVPASSLEALAGLKTAGKKIGLVSNADVTEVMAWPESPLAPFFDSTVISCHVGQKKPDAEIYETSLQELGLPAEQVLFVGDGGSSELRGARAVGLTTVMMRGIIADLYPDLIAERRVHADYEVDELTELVPVAR